MKPTSGVVLKSRPVSRKVRRLPLDALFPKTRQNLLATMLLDLGRERYLTDLARHLEVPPSSLQRELAALVEAGILLTRKDGNRTYYRANRECPFHAELRDLFRKTVGVRDVLRSSFKGLEDRIEVAFIHGSFAAGTGGSATSEIDVMVIGEAGLVDLAPGLKRAEQELGRVINPSTYTRDGIALKLAGGHHWLRSAMDGEKLFIRGDASTLAAALGAEPNEAPLTSSCPGNRRAISMDTS